MKEYKYTIDGKEYKVEIGDIADNIANVTVNGETFKVEMEPEPEPEPTPTPSQSETMAWIPKSGSKYHSYSGCSNMKNPSQVTKSQAEAKGYTACKKCW